MANPFRARTLGVLGAGLVVVAAVIYGPPALFHILPVEWSGEADRLARVLRLSDNSAIAEIGAGTGWMAAALAERIGPAGRIYATEISPALRDAIARRAGSAALENLLVVEAGERETGLPDRCCDAIFMRNVLHHLADWPAAGQGVVSALRPGGRFVVIDFPPGTFLHLGRQHGADADKAVAAFSNSGLNLVERDDRWGGGYYMLAFELANRISGR